MPIIAPGYYLSTDLQALNTSQLMKCRISHNNKTFCSTAHFSLDKKCNALSLLGDYLEEGILAFAVENKTLKLITIWQETLS